MDIKSSRHTVFLVLLLSTLINSSCTDPSQDIVTDNTPPITDGNWYRPTVSATWHWQLLGEINTSYDVDIYDIDLFDIPLATIQSLQTAGKKVICYFSAGSYEEWRSDASQFQTADLGKTLDGWEDEKWLDVRSDNVRTIMKTRLDLAVSKGCDGVEPDNMDGYANDSGFNLSANDQLSFNRFIANEAHTRDLSVGLKNDLDQIAQLVDYFDFSVNEQCFEYDECETLGPFINQGKPVLNAEYKSEYVSDASSRQTLCDQSTSLQFSTLILPLDLDDGIRYDCVQ